MKLTKKHLKALIQEELDNIGEGFRTDRKAATKTAGKDLGMNKTGAPEEPPRSGPTPQKKLSSSERQKSMRAAATDLTSQGGIDPTEHADIDELDKDLTQYAADNKLQMGKVGMLLQKLGAALKKGK